MKGDCTTLLNEHEFETPRLEQAQAKGAPGEALKRDPDHDWSNVALPIKAATAAVHIVATADDEDPAFGGIWTPS